MDDDKKRRRVIYDRSNGYCHICRKKVAFTNYGKAGERGSWEIDHSNPRANGGTDRLNNLYPACISCNRSKQHGSTRTERDRYGHTKAPYSRERANEFTENNTWAGAVAGASTGAMVGGACLGSNTKPS